MRCHKENMRREVGGFNVDMEFRIKGQKTDACYLELSGSKI